MKRPVTSIIIPARNMEQYLETTLHSVVNQTADNFEVIVIDDRSTDQTADIVNKLIEHHDYIRMVPGKGRGVSAARNLGASLASGSILLFLDADDVLAPDAIERFEAGMARNPHASAVLGGLRRISDNGRQLPGSDNRELVPDEDQLKALLRKNFVVNGGNLAVRASDYLRVSGYDEALSNGEDWVFWCRIAAVGKIEVLTGDPVLLYRQVASGANAKKRLPLVRVPSIETIARDNMINDLVGKDLRRLLNLRRADYYWSGVRNELLYGTRRRTAYMIVIGMFAYPQSFTQPYIALRFVRSLALRD